MSDRAPAETWKCENCGSDDGPHFDRSICACGSMHYYCGDCGSQDDACDERDIKPRFNVQRPVTPADRAPQQNEEREAFAILRDACEFIEGDLYLASIGEQTDEAAAIEACRRNGELREALRLCGSMAGNPDAAQGCRNIIAHVKATLGDAALSSSSTRSTEG